MSYRISEQKVVSIDKATGKTVIEVVLFASSSENIPDYDDIAGNLLAAGSLAIIASESKVYVLDLDNEWKEWGAEGDDTRSLSVSPSVLTKSAGIDELREPEVLEEPEEEVKQDEPSKRSFDFE